MPEGKKKGKSRWNQLGKKRKRGGIRDVNNNNKGASKLEEYKIFTTNKKQMKKRRGAYSS